VKGLVTGAGGQLAVELERSLPNGIALVALSIDDLDITNREEVLRVVGEASPDILINAAGYTAVDRAEEEASLAMRVNGDGTRHLAEAAEACSASFVHVSTDFVFDGTGSEPYEVDAVANPLSVYGRSKLAGELAAHDVLGEAALIVRTAWLYTAHGSNFLRTMLRIMKEQGAVRVVDDQLGTPTWARTLAEAIWRLLDLDARGTYHVTDSGTATWYEFAVAIRDGAVEQGLLVDAVVEPISTAEYPTAAHRPAYSVLDCTRTDQVIGKSTPHWRTSLSNCLQELVAAEA